ncbi:MAG: hypothetical protein KAH77_09965 [Thiomargarita sp.]|nr:hypothetical protein [Thiomargarita sp.]
MTVQQQLQKIIKKLPSEQQHSLLEFAEFLHSRIVETLPQEPQISPRPLKESVIAAIKRLSKSYPMLDKAVMLNETSHLMSEHILHGRDKIDVINQLETLFLQSYQKYTDSITT